MNPANAPSKKKKQQQQRPSQNNTNEPEEDSELISPDAVAGEGGGGGSATVSSSNFRNVSACNRCRLRKNRCDQKLPACTSCEKANAKYGPATFDFELTVVLTM